MKILAGLKLLCVRQMFVVVFFVCLFLQNAFIHSQFNTIVFHYNK